MLLLIALFDLEPCYIHVLFVIGISADVW